MTRPDGSKKTRAYAAMPSAKAYAARVVRSQPDTRHAHASTTTGVTVFNSGKKNILPGTKK